MADPRWRMLPVPFLMINYVVMTSLLLLNIIYVLANFLGFVRDLTITFRFMSTLTGNLNSAENFHNITS